MYKPIKTISIVRDGEKYMLILADRTGAGVSAGVVFKHEFRFIE